MDGRYTDDEMENIWKETVLSRYTPKGTRGKHKNP
jgi:hypothetical protein